MKNFANYDSKKYKDENYEFIENSIYRSKVEDKYVTSLTFEMESTDGYDGENPSPQNITQFPFEAILDEFMVWVSDFYEELNAKSEVTCYQEFASSELDDIKALRTLIGKRVYGKIHDPNDDDSDWSLIIE
ncbi:MAG: hypothetical protein R3Y12_08300 [Clostridia bacterium]